MKKLIVLFATLTIVCQAEDAFHDFTTEDGRTLKAKVLSYDALTGKVQILRTDKKKVTVNSGVFSEKDQSYIKAWSAAKNYMSPSKLKLDLNQNEAKPTKKEHKVDLGDIGRRGESGTQIVAVDKKTKYQFNLFLENKGDVPLNNLTLEYRIYYEQEKATQNKNQSQNNPNKNRPTRHTAVTENKVKEGKVKIDTIVPHESKEVSTGSVTITKRSATILWGDMINLKGTVNGAWVKITMKGPDGTKLIREIAYPESIMKKYPWDSEEGQEQE